MLSISLLKHCNQHVAKPCTSLLVCLVTLFNQGVGLNFAFSGIPSMVFKHLVKCWVLNPLFRPYLASDITGLYHAFQTLK